uniref:AAA+ ATPase domain-containing protein n=1 Tax=Parascaris univalens TaxID=6257 RepID=A0A915BXW0_PARUN
MATQSPSSSASKAELDSASSPDNINLRLILVSGKTKEFLFASNVSAQEITQFVFDNWPQEWEEERVGSSSLLKLIYHGRFLHGSVTLSALSLPAGKTTVMHLVTRENLPEPNSGALNCIKHFKNNVHT